MRPYAVAMSVLAAAMLLGLFSRAADQVPWNAEGPLVETLVGIGNAPTPWLIAAFIVGAVARRVILGAVAATVALIGAVAIYYLLIGVTDERSGVPLLGVGLAWAAVSAVAGPVLGAAGGRWRSGSPAARRGGAAILGGSLVAVGLFTTAASIAYWPAKVGARGRAAYPASEIRVRHRRRNTASVIRNVNVPASKATLPAVPSAKRSVGAAVAVSGRIGPGARRASVACSKS